MWLIWLQSKSIQIMKFNNKINLLKMTEAASAEYLNLKVKS
jgi:hypothetical protein